MSELRPIAKHTSRLPHPDVVPWHPGTIQRSDRPHTEVPYRLRRWRALFPQHRTKIEQHLLRGDRTLDVVHHLLASDPDFRQCAIDLYPHTQNRRDSFHLTDVPLKLALFEDFERYRFALENGAMFESTPALDLLLDETDTGANTPAEYLRLPFDSMYIRFGEGRHAFQSAAPSVLVQSELNDSVLCCCGLYLRKGRTADLWVTFTGLTDQEPSDEERAYLSFSLHFSSSAELLEPALERAIDVARNDNAQVSNRDFRLERRVLFHAAKLLLYLNTADARRVARAEGSASAEARQGLATRKANKRERQGRRAYDRIVIGPSEDTIATQLAARDRTSPRNAHWRRGHFRHQPFGAGRRERRLQWVRPALISASQWQSVPPKAYQIVSSCETGIDANRS